MGSPLWSVLFTASHRVRIILVTTLAVFTQFAQQLVSSQLQPSEETLSDTSTRWTSRPWSHFRETLVDDLIQFSKIYKDRPLEHNRCGVQFNHAFGLWREVKRLADRNAIDTVLESGFNQGQSTYLLRHALGVHENGTDALLWRHEQQESRAGSNQEKVIISMDPLSEPICQGDRRRIFINSAAHTYLLGPFFTDITDLDFAQGNLAESPQELQRLLSERITNLRMNEGIRDQKREGESQESTEKASGHLFQSACESRCKSQCKSHEVQGHDRSNGSRSLASSFNISRMIYNPDLTELRIVELDLLDAEESHPQPLLEEKAGSYQPAADSKIDPFWLRTFYDAVKPERALVFLDDHVAPLVRLASLRARGFKRFILDDNYPPGLGWSRGERLLTPKQILASAGRGSGERESVRPVASVEEKGAAASASAAATKMKKTAELEWFENNVVEYTVIPPVLSFPALFGTEETTEGILQWNFHKRFSSAEGVGSCFRRMGGEKVDPAALLNAEHDDDMHIVDRIMIRTLNFNLLDVQTDPEKYLHYFGYCWMSYIELK
ncbi:unnamed protein product [Amoebophrya sp. A120]|nr:unnamed protein product [Amoebophrya sp. A120]|eukprot:GSA120T00022722001.1